MVEAIVTPILTGVLKSGASTTLSYGVKFVQEGENVGKYRSDLIDALSSNLGPLPVLCQPDPSSDAGSVDVASSSSGSSSRSVPDSVKKLMQRLERQHEEGRDMLRDTQAWEHSRKLVARNLGFRRKEKHSRLLRGHTEQIRRTGSDYVPYATLESSIDTSRRLNELRAQLPNLTMEVRNSSTSGSGSERSVSRNGGESQIRNLGAEALKIIRKVEEDLVDVAQRGEESAIADAVRGSIQKLTALVVQAAAVEWTEHSEAEANVGAAGDQIDVEETSVAGSSESMIDNDGSMPHYDGHIPIMGESSHPVSVTESSDDKLSRASREAATFQRIQVIPGRCLIIATRKFSMKIRENEASDTYEGILPDGTHIAVKVWRMQKYNHLAEPNNMVTQMNLMNLCQHQYILKIVGRCSESSVESLQQYMSLKSDPRSKPVREKKEKRRFLHFKSPRSTEAEQILPNVSKKPTEIANEEVIDHRSNSAVGNKKKHWRSVFFNKSPQSTVPEDKVLQEIDTKSNEIFTEAVSDHRSNSADEMKGNGNALHSNSGRDTETDSIVPRIEEQSNESFGEEATTHTSKPADEKKEKQQTIDGSRKKWSVFVFKTSQSPATEPQVLPEIDRKSDEILTEALSVNSSKSAGEITGHRSASDFNSGPDTETHLIFRGIEENSNESCSEERTNHMSNLADKKKGKQRNADGNKKKWSAFVYKTPQSPASEHPVLQEIDTKSNEILTEAVSDHSSKSADEITGNGSALHSDSGCDKENGLIFPGIEGNSDEIFIEEATNQTSNPSDEKKEKRRTADGGKKKWSAFAFKTPQSSAREKQILQEIDTRSDEISTEAMSDHNSKCAEIKGNGTAFHSSSGRNTETDAVFPCIEQKSNEIFSQETTNHNPKPADEKNEKRRTVDGNKKKWSMFKGPQSTVPEQQILSEIYTKSNDADHILPATEKKSNENLNQEVNPKATQNLSMLVLEYQTKGDVSNYLQGGSKSHRKYSGDLLVWESRLEILLGTARGLAYVHSRGIVHMDIKPRNIFLGMDWSPKIGGFDFSTSLTQHSVEGLDRTSWGTPGYQDPEFLQTNLLSYKADVYGFGVTILNVVSGRGQPFVGALGSSVPIRDWAQNLFVTGNLRDIMTADLTLKDELLDRIGFDRHLTELLQIAFLCTQFSALSRPAMVAVVSLLKDIVDGWTLSSGYTS